MDGPINNNNKNPNEGKAQDRAEKRVEEMLGAIESKQGPLNGQNKTHQKMNGGGLNFNKNTKNRENPINGQGENSRNTNSAYLNPYDEIKEENIVSDPASQRSKRVKNLLWSAIGLVGVFIIILLVAFVWQKPESFVPADLSEPTVFKPGNVFSEAVKPYIADDVVFPEGIQERFKNTYAAESNFVGWLRVPNTSIDMPVYQSKGSNDRYLKHDIWGSFSDYGVVFMEHKNDIVNMDRNTVLYGHNYDLTDDDKYTDLQFGEIEQYRKLEFYKENPVIEFNTLYKDYKWKVIACFVSNGTSKDDRDGDENYLFSYHATRMNDENFMEYIDELSQRSYIHTGVDVLPTDKILTLSTCTYFFDKPGVIQNARCALVARMVREGESEEVDVSKATKNENIRYPQLYYNVFGGTNPYRNVPKWFPKS